MVKIICECCGFILGKGKHKIHIDLRTKKPSNICEWCWIQPSLYFNDKKILKPKLNPQTQFYYEYTDKVQLKIRQEINIKPYRKSKRCL